VLCSPNKETGEIEFGSPHQHSFPRGNGANRALSNSPRAPRSHQSSTFGNAEITSSDEVPPPPPTSTPPRSPNDLPPTTTRLKATQQRWLAELPGSNEQNWKRQAQDLQMKVDEQNLTIASLRNQVAMWKERAESLRMRVKPSPQNSLPSGTRVVGSQNLNNNSRKRTGIINKSESSSPGRNEYSDESQKNQRLVILPNTSTSRLKSNKFSREPYGLQKKSAVDWRKSSHPPSRPDVSITNHKQETLSIGALPSRPNEIGPREVVQVNTSAPWNPQQSDRKQQRKDWTPGGASGSSVKWEPSAQQKGCSAPDRENRTNNPYRSVDLTATTSRPEHIIVIDSPSNNESPRGYETKSSYETTRRSTLKSRIKCGKGHDMEVVDVAYDNWKKSVDCAKCSATKLEKFRRFVWCSQCLYHLCTKCMYRERAANRQKAGENRGRQEPNPEDVLTAERFEAFVSRPVNGVCLYYQNSSKKHQQHTTADGYELLKRLVWETRTLLKVNTTVLMEQRKTASILLQQGKQIYYKYWFIKSRSTSWSQEEYTHPGFQRWYLHSESIPRFTATWSMLEGALAAGAIGLPINNAQRVASIGGGPGFELIACNLFFRQHWPSASSHLTCLDLCPTWGRYVNKLGYRFERWDVRSGRLLDLLGLKKGELDYVLLSSVVASLRDEEMVELLSSLLLHDQVRAVLVSARDLNSRTCEKVRALGIEVVSLLDQVQDSSERQLALVVSRTGPPRETRDCLFPGKPVEKHK